MAQVTAMEFLDVRLFLVGMVLLIALTMYITWHRHRHFGILPLTGFIFVLFSAFKYGYVRHDAHELAATSQLVLIALIVLAMAQPWARASGGQALLLTALATVFAACFNLAILTRYSPQGFLPALAETLGLRSLAAPLAVTRGNAPFVCAQQDYYSAIRDHFPLPHVTGTVDLYPWSQILVFAHGLDYHPRPVMQSYSAYTPRLAEMNAAFLRGPQAPENILFSIYPIDDRYPTSDDGLSWPDLLTRYDPVSLTTNGFLVLHHSANPRTFRKILLEESVISFDANAAVPPTRDGPIWAEIEINESTFGRVLSALYKPPHLKLAVKTVDGRNWNFRLIPGMARAGFMLSPFIGDTEIFAQLAAGTNSDALKNLQISSLSVYVEDETGASRAYQNSIKLRLYRLEISPSAGPAKNAAAGPG